MAKNFNFDPGTLETLVGGLSSLDIRRLSIQSLEEAENFVLAYGYDIKDEAQRNRLWKYYRRAVTYISTELLNEEESFPSALSDPNELKNLLYLLIYASTSDQREGSLQNWSCAILKVMHVLVHLDNDLFNRYYGEIQDQLLRPIQDYIQSDPVTGITLGSASNINSVSLKKFELKAFKTSDSAITKLLAKREEVAFRILDKIGVRFVTKHLFDAFSVMRFLVQKNLVSYPHNISDQSNNTLYPVNIFMEVIENFTSHSDVSIDEIDQILKEKLEQSLDRAEYNKKTNSFTSDNYRFIKFITRRLCHVKVGEEMLSFFYPFEVQIMDYETYLKNMTGSSSHDEYKRRQKRRARARVLGTYGSDLENSFSEEDDDA